MTSRITRAAVDAPKLSGATWRRLLHVSTALAAISCVGAPTRPAWGQASVTMSGDVNPYVSNPPSHWTVPFLGFLFVGYNGTATGTLTVSGGGSVSSNFGYVGWGSDAIGVVTVSGMDDGGNASAWTGSAGLYIGFMGNGTLTVAAGGKVSASLIELAPLGTGILNLNGSAASGRGVLEAGYVARGAGAATLNLDGGILRAAGNESDFLRGFGALTAGPGGIRIDSNGHDIGIGPSTAFAGTSSFDKIGAGTLTLTGDSSGFAGTVRIDAGTLNIAQGGRLGGSSGAIGKGLGDTGGVTVSGADGSGNASAWVNSGALQVGDAGNGALTVAAGGVVSAATVELASAATGAGILNLNGSAASGRGVLEAGYVARGAGAATLNLDGGILRASGDQSDFLRGFGVVTAGAEGIRIDSNGHDIRIGPSTAFAGSSSFDKIGAGTLTLTGDSSGFTGATTVSAGALLVGDAAGHGKLGGAVNIGGGAMLGGTGVLTGPVSIDGTLSAGNSPGTLTFADSLTLNAGSKSVFELNSPGVVGGSGVSGNDLVVVNGDLVLGGALEARVAAAGYYRLFNYGGALTGAFSGGVVTGIGGFAPVTGNPDVQYGIPGQINLSVLAGGQTMQFWDGPDHTGNGVVDGGAGTWSANGTNWTGRPGQAGINGTWVGSVGVFAGQAGGVVTVTGAQNLDTLQFSANGYDLRGGALTIGAAGGGVLNIDSGVATTIASTIADGAGLALIKTGGGTLLLSGTNSYTGGTVLSGGVLSVGSDAGLGAASGALTFDGGALRTTASFDSARAVTLTQAGRFDVAAGTGLGLRGTVSGPGDLVKSGGGALLLSGINSYGGGTMVTAGVLSGDAAAIHGDIANAGTVIFDQAADAAFAGDIAGLGGIDGAMVKRGAGVLTLTGSSTLNWTIAAGGLTTAAQRFGGDAAIGGGASLTFEQTGDAVYGGVLSGGGGLIKAGPGALTLAGVNTYGGGTTLSGGVLSVAADAGLGAASGALTFDGGALRTTASFDSARAVTLTQAGRFDVAAGTGLGLRGTVSGPGDLVKSGDGALLLSGINSYGGGTMVTAGVLSGDAAAIRGDIANAGTVIFDQAADAAFAGNIAGYNGVDGAMVKRGAGVLTLTGSSMLNWSIEAGGLTTAAQRFGGDAAIGGGASLTFEQTGDAVYGGVLSGSGGLNLAGSGPVMLTGNSSAFAGLTTVGRGAALIVGDAAGNGKLGGAVTIAAGGLLGGTGTVGSVGSMVSIVAGAVHAPGDSIGAQTVAGDYANHGTLRIEAAPAGADRVVVAGSVDIVGAVLDLVLTPTDAANWNVFNGPLTIIDKRSAGAVAGSFAAVTKNLLFLDAVLAYDGGDGNDVTLALNRNDVTFAGVGRTRNQIAAGAAVDTLGNTSPVWRAIALGGDPDIVRVGFDALSGEIHASARTVLIEDSRFLRNAVNDRIRSAFGAVAASRDPVATYGDGRPQPSAATADRLAVWSSGFGSWGHADGDGNAGRLKRAASGVFIGVDGPILDAAGFGDWRFGAVAGYSRTSFDVTDVHSSGASDNSHVGVYGGATWEIFGGSLAFRAGLAYARHDIDTRRAVAMPGLGDNPRGAGKAGTAQAFGELGYGLRAGRLAFEPFANLAHVSLRTDGFTERGGAAALTGAAATTDGTFTTLGLRAAATFDVNGNRLTTTGMLGWRHGFGAVGPGALMRFAAGGDPFIVAGVPIARDAAMIEAGLRYGLTQAAALGVAYGGQFGSGAFDQSLRANFNLKF